MKFAGVDLDKRIDEQSPVSMGITGQHYSKGLSPFVRVSGIEIKMGLKYYNYRLDDLDTTYIPHGGKDSDVFCRVDLEPNFGWNTWNMES